MNRESGCSNESEGRERKEGLLDRLDRGGEAADEVRESDENGGYMYSESVGRKERSTRWDLGYLETHLCFTIHSRWITPEGGIAGESGLGERGRGAVYTVFCSFPTTCLSNISSSM